MKTSTDVILPSNEYVLNYCRTHQEGFYRSWFVTVELGTKNLS